MVRLFALQDVPRSATVNTREYLAQIGRRHKDAHKHAAEITRLFEQARYGAQTLDQQKIELMWQLYRTLYQQW